MTMREIALAIACVLGGCSGSSESTAPQEPSRAAPLPPAAPAAPAPAPSAATPTAAGSTTLTCTDRSSPDEHGTATFAVGRPEICVHDPETRTLRVETSSDRGDSLGVYITSFTGPGTYTTTGTDEGVMISMRAQGADGNVDVSSNGGDCPARPCTIVVGGQLDAPEGQPRPVVLDVTCPSLGGAGVDCVECTLAPATIHVAVPSCEG